MGKIQIYVSYEWYIEEFAMSTIEICTDYRYSNDFAVNDSVIAKVL